MAWHTIAKISAWSASAALLSCGIGLASAEDNAPKPKPDLKPIPVHQKRLGAEMEGFGRALSDLLEEYHQNNMGDDGKDIESQEESRKKIEDITGMKIPKILQNLREGELKRTAEGQDEVVVELDAMIKKLQKEVGPAEAVHAIDNAIRLQKEVNRKLEDNKERDPAREGKPPQELTGDQRRDNAETSAKEREVNPAIAAAVTALKRHADSIRPDDPAAASKIDQTVSELTGQKPGEKSDVAADDIDNNRPSQAHKKGDEIIAVLMHAKNNLPGNDDPVKRAENHLDRLERIKHDQDDAHAETSGLKPSDDEGTNRAMGKQGDVTAGLDDARGNDHPELDPLIKQSKTIGHKIADGKPGEAHDGQGELGHELDRAIARAKSDVAAAKAGKGQPGKPGQPGQPGSPDSAPGEGDPSSETAQQPGEQAKPGEGKETKEHQAGVGTIQFGHLRTQQKEAQWNVSLAAKDRADVMQAESAKFPQRYRRQIMNYFQSLAGE